MVALGVDPWRGRGEGRACVKLSSCLTFTSKILGNTSCCNYHLAAGHWICTCSLSHPLPVHVLHGESNTGQASPRTPTQRTFQPQEAVQPQRNQTILQPDTPAQKANYSYKWSHPTPHEADAHTSHVNQNAPSRAQSPGGRPPSTCTHRCTLPVHVH